MINLYIPNSIISNEWIRELLLGWGTSVEMTSYISMIVLVIISVLSVIILQVIVAKSTSFFLRKVIDVSHLSFFEYALKNKVHRHLALLISYLFFSATIPIIFDGFPRLASNILKLTNICIVIVIVQIFISVIRSLLDVLRERPAFEHKPIKSYIQVVKIFLYIIAAVSIYSIISEKSPVVFLTAMGAASALLMLMFQSTIMGFVASIQVSSNNIVEIGDRVIMNKFGANGHVLELTLTTVKVKNLDETITTIPTQALISDSFENWRAMIDGGVRHFKRAMDIKQSSIKWLEDEELEKYKEVQGLSIYIDRRLADYKEYNEKQEVKSNPLNQIKITNIALFTEYLTYFMKHHPHIHQGKTILARQLPPTDAGSPVELFAFTKTSNWEEYERIHGEIFSHALLAAAYFDLEIHEAFAMSDKINLKMNQLGSL